MHGVNLDLLRACSTHHPDGRPKDPHAHHRAELQALARAGLRSRWLTRLRKLRSLLAANSAAPVRACEEKPL